jgi:surface antigen
MFVKKWTAVGKSFLLVVSLILAGCATTNTNTSRSTYSSANDNYQNNNSVVAVFANLTRWKIHMLSKEDQVRQEQAVFFALNNLDQGQMTEWRNEQTGAKGAVVVMSSYPQGSGYCRTVNSEIYYRGKTRNFVETACVNGVEPTWRFIR